MKNYKEKYEQAIENLKKIKKANRDNKELVDFIEYQYPELKESEDEKIRKSILEEFKVKAIGGYEEKFFRNGVKIKDAIAWLEKQNKPQVRTGNEWVNIIDDACEHRYAEEYAHGEYCHQQSFRWGFQEGVDWFEKQVEQKPTWSEEDELNFNQAIYVCHQYQYVGVETWLKSLKQRMKGV